MLILLLAPLTLACKSTVHLGPCNFLQQRTVFIKNSDDCLDKSQKIENFDCKFECPAGSFLDFSPAGQVVCSLCDKGKFSLGGGSIYGAGYRSWNDSLGSALYSECWVKINSTEYHDYKCSGWASEGSRLVTSPAPGPSSYTANLILSLSIVKQGSFHIRYKKDSFTLNGLPVGSFSIFINSDKVFEDSLLKSSDWRLFKHPLTIGKSEIIIEYSTRSSQANPSPRAEISTIEVVGSQYADLKCLDCLVGSSSQGAASCDWCEQDQYAQDGVCEACPEGTYAIRGSVGLKSCREREPCSLKDLQPVLSKCENGTRTRKFDWIQPVLCAKQGFEPPKDERVECQCEPGWFSPAGEDCRVCGPGKYFDGHSAECRACSPGEYLSTFKNISSWSPLPAGFSSYCLTLAGWSCNPSAGWTAHQGYLTTFYAQQQDELRHLYYRVNIVNHKGRLAVSYYLNSSHSRIDVYVDGHVYDTWQRPGQNLATIELTEGLHDLEWVFWTLSSIPVEGRIHYIEIHGADQGVALGCLACDDAHIGPDGVKCAKCPAGRQGDALGRSCVLCPEGFYSTHEGENCTSCPSSSYAGANRTYCLGRSMVKAGGLQYYLGNITGTGHAEQVYTNGICRMPSSQLYCKQTFYGPLPGEGKAFYVSIVNPSQLDLLSIPHLFNRSFGYVFGLFDKEELSHEKLSFDDSCSEKRVIVNMGQKYKGLVKTANGLSFIYSDGDLCTHSGKRFETVVNLVCDKSTGVGWPSFNSSHECTYYFIWKSKYGCPVCPYQKLRTVSGECRDGKRNYKKVENEDCIIPYSFTIEWNSSCSEAAEALATKEMIAGLALLGLLTLAGIISTVCFFKYKHGYEVLAQDTERTSK